MQPLFNSIPVLVFVLIILLSNMPISQRVRFMLFVIFDCCHLYYLHFLPVSCYTYISNRHIFDYFLQLLSMQKEMQKQISVLVAVPVTKEGRRLEATLGRSMEKSVKANADALWANILEENAKHEKLVRDRTQQITSLITNSLNKDLPAILEKTVKKEMAAVVPAVARTITPVVEKTISSAITETFQVKILKI